MTALTVPVASVDPSRHPRRALLRATLRQHRAAIAGLLIVSAGFGLRLVVTGRSIHLAYARYLAGHCATARLPACPPALLNQLDERTWVIFGGVTVALVPVLAGVFVGAPLAAREFETGAFRFSFVQGVSARRQLVAKLIVIGTAVLITGIVLGVLSMWAMAPLHHQITLGNAWFPGLSSWTPNYFNVTAVTLPAWALLDFCLGVVAGAAVRRVMPAMAAALAAIMTIAILGGGSGWSTAPLYRELVRVAPIERAGLVHIVVDSDMAGSRRGIAYPDLWPGPDGSVVVTGWLAAGGQRLSAPAAKALVNRIPAPVVALPARARSWLATRHVAYWIGYQPASRYWLFQGAIAAILLALAGIAGFIAVRLVGRRR